MDTWFLILFKELAAKMPMGKPTSQVTKEQ
jgi:hypothetical protein